MEGDTELPISLLFPGQGRPRGTDVHTTATSASKHPTPAVHRAFSLPASVLGARPGQAQVKHGRGSDGRPCVEGVKRWPAWLPHGKGSQAYWAPDVATEAP